MHSQTITRYFISTFHTLFSKNFLNIVGTSLLVSAMMTMILYFLGVFLLYRGAEMIVSGNGAEIIRFFFQGYIVLIVMIIAVLMSRGWLATVIPIRAIDKSHGIHFQGDTRLFHEHFGKYISYFFWYSMILFFLWNAYIILTIVLWAIHPNFGILSLIGGAIYIIRVSTRYSLSWYHMLSEGAGSLDVFTESRKYVHGRIVEVFLKMLGFAILVWILSFLIELFLMGFLGEPSVSGALGKVSSLLIENGAPLLDRMRDMILTLEESYGQISFMGIVISLIYSLSSVISRAMLHIFSVHYYLHLRDEWEEGK